MNNRNMPSFNTAIHPTQASSVTNVGGDHLTFRTRNIIIINYHVHPPAASTLTPPDRGDMNAGEHIVFFVHGTTFVLIVHHTDEGAPRGDQAGALPDAARDAEIVVSVTAHLSPSTICTTWELTVIMQIQRAPRSAWERFLSIFGL